MLLRRIQILLLISLLSIFGYVLAADVASPPNSLVVDTTGFVGISNATPTSSLHVRGPNTDNAQIYVENTTAVNAERVLFRLTNLGKTRFRIDNGANTWTFDNSGSNFEISKIGTGVAELSVNQNGNMTIQGTLIQSSSRTVKRDIEDVNTQQVLAKVLALPIAEWSYKKDAGTRHMGPMSEDFSEAFGLGATSKGLSTIDTGGVALAAIQGLKEMTDDQLHRLREEKDREIFELKAELAEVKLLVRTLLASTQ